MSDASPTQAALSEALDQALLDVIKNGRLVTDKDGKAILDEDGKPLRERPTAADMNAAISRLRALGITKLITEDSAAAELAKECGLEDPNVLKFPEISDDPTEEATGTF